MYVILSRHIYAAARLTLPFCWVKSFTLVMPEYLTKSVKDACICRMQKKQAMRARCAKGSGGPGFSCSLSTFTLLMRQNQMNIIVSLMK